MTDIGPLVKLLQEQIDKQEERHRQQLETQKEQVQTQKKQMDMQRLEFAKQMEALISRLGTGSPAPVAPAVSVPSFTAFDSTSELWRDYMPRFHTFVGANSNPKEKIAQVFLTNQTTTIQAPLHIGRTAGAIPGH